MCAKKLIVLAIVFSLCVQSVFASENTGKSTKHLEIIHLRQFHAHSGAGVSYQTADPIAVEKTTLSQYNIAKYILKNPGIPVFKESLYEDIDYKNSNCDKGGSICAILREKVFFSGFPDSFDRLTKLQKQALYEFGGERILVYLGIISKIHKTIEQKLSDEIDKRFKDGHYYRYFERIDPTKGVRASIKEMDYQAYVNLFEIRGKAALSNIERALENNSQDFAQGQVFLVFGAEHDFQEECQKRGYKLTEINLTSDELDALDNKDGNDANFRKRYPIDDSIISKKNLELSVKLKTFLEERGLSYNSHTIFNELVATDYIKIDECADLLLNNPFLLDCFRYDSFKEALVQNAFDPLELSTLNQRDQKTLCDSFSYGLKHGIQFLKEHGVSVNLTAPPKNPIMEEYEL